MAFARGTWHGKAHSSASSLCGIVLRALGAERTHARAWFLFSVRPAAAYCNGFPFAVGGSPDLLETLLYLKQAIFALTTSPFPLVARLNCWNPYFKQTLPFLKVSGVGGLSSYGGNLALQSLLVAVMTYIITISIGKTFQRINDNAYKINGGQASEIKYSKSSQVFKSSQVSKSSFKSSLKHSKSNQVSKSSIQIKCWTSTFTH